jgi:ribokinase/sulfofructose kinase
MARAARDAGAIVTADIDNVYEGVENLLPLIDVLITSSEFPNRLTGIIDLRTALVELKMRFGCPIIGATLGAQGRHRFFSEGQFDASNRVRRFRRLSRYDWRRRCLSCGFLSTRCLHGEDLEDCMRTANALCLR